MSDLSLVLEQLKKNNEEESSRDTNINKNIAFSRKSNQESLEHIERAVIASNKETVDNDKIAASAEKETKKEHKKLLKKDNRLKTNERESKDYT